MTEMPSTNPLRKFFREPGIYIKLPTMGYFNPGEIDFTASGEIPIYPMTAYDELLLKNPDALLNGDAIERIIMSCVPDIKNPRNLCTPDVDTILLAIRASSYGDIIEYQSNCPKCNKENTYATSIRFAVETVAFHEPAYPVEVGKNVLVHIRPRSFATATKAAIKAFEQQKLLQEIAKATEIDDLEKNAIFRDSFEKISNLNFELIADSIISVTIPQGTVVEPEFIKEWLVNTDTRSVKKIEKEILRVTEIGVNKKHAVSCPNCQHEWESNIIFDPSYFFG
jgi:hypothetical protein